MSLDAVLLSRLQFAFTIGYHILWPAYTIGISGFIVILNLLWLITRRPVYREQLRFWIRLFALGFAMGVVTGVVLSYEIGANWSVFAARTSNVIGPFFSYEVQTAFFLEAGFIGIMLFGMDRFPERLHVLACAMVALGAIASAFWIIAANSWMQTPAGFSVEGGQFHIASWWSAIFSPSFPYRLAHMIVAAYLTGAFTVLGVMGWYLWRREHLAFAQAGFSAAMWIALVLTPLQLAIGDLHGRNSFRLQPVKVAAMEGDWETRTHQPLILFAWPDMVREHNYFTLALPDLGSLILTHRADGVVPGLKSVPHEDRPNVPIVFFAFRIMVGSWILLTSLALIGLWLRWRGRLYDTSWFSFMCAFASPVGFIAILCGWTVTEVGRQPWIVYGLLRTAEASAPVTAGAVAASFALFIGIYIILLAAFFYYAMRVVLAGPQAPKPAHEPLAVRPGRDSAPARAKPVEQRDGA
jgi:cytochrome bd ubiquinol oxidase subunit I